MRLIDADKLIDLLNKKYDGDENINESVLYLVGAISGAPTVDAMEVVRCKDCKWYEESIYPELRPTRFCYRLTTNTGVHVGYNWDSNDFCSYGERRENEAN